MANLEIINPSNAGGTNYVYLATIGAGTNLSPFSLVTTNANINAAFVSPDGSLVGTNTTLRSLLFDDFGGSAVNAITSNWTILDGGLGANPNLGNGTLTQTAIGSGIAMGTGGNVPANTAFTVAASVLTITMGATLGAELWLLSNQVFAGKEDIRIVCSKSQPLAANSIFIGLVEVDPTTLCPLLNPNFAADGNGSSEFTNRGGCEYGLTTTTTAYQAEAIGDQSSAKATGVVGVATVLTTKQEYLIEIDTNDVNVSSRTVDAVSGASASSSRVSSQAPNDTKLYKLVVRLKNVTTPATSTTFAISKLVVEDNYTQRVQISSGEGDNIAQKAIAVNITGSLTGASAIAVIPEAAASATGGLILNTTLIALGTTNSTLVAAGTKRLLGGSISNVAAAVRYLKFYNKATAPTVGTDAPVATIALQPNTTYSLLELYGNPFGTYFPLGIGFGMTVNAALADTTAVTAGDLIINVVYI